MTIRQRDKVVDTFEPRFKSTTAYAGGIEIRAHKEKLNALSIVDFWNWAHDYYNGDFEQLMTASWSELLRQFFYEYFEALRSEIDFSDYPYDVEDMLSKFHTEFLERFLERYINSSMWQIYNLLDQGNPQEAIEQRLEKWRTTRPAAVAINETTRAAGGLFLTAAFAMNYGVRWRTRSNRCAFCALLEGKRIRQGQYFAQGGDELKPKGKPAMKIRSKTGHPPVHRACRCYLTAVKE